MTEGEFKEVCSGLPILDLLDPEINRFLSVRDANGKKAVGFNGTLEITDAAEAAAARHRPDLLIKRGLRERIGDQIVVRALFWKRYPPA